MNENKTSRYFKYAIGEIILVVVGILIALQINNWNEDKKERITEQKILKELLVDLEISKADLENDLRINKKWLKTSEAVKKHLYYKKVYHDSIEEMLITASNMSQFTPRTSGYQNLKSVGLNIIANDSLRKEITNVFERSFEYSRLEGREFDKIDNSIIELNSFFIKYFTIDIDRESKLTFRNKAFSHKTNGIKIVNYQALLNEQELLLTLQKTIYDRFGKIRTYATTVRKIDQVSSMIETQLTQLKNN